MYNDHVAANRTHWFFKYKAKEILPYAQKLLTFHSAKEKEAREKTASLLVDVNVNQSDPRFAELKKEITHHGTMKEQCEVFVHQFSKEGDIEYELGLGDVTFFELNKTL